MSLDWDLGRIKDWKTVCFDGEGDDATMKYVTSSLIELTINLGICNFTDKNIEEVILRIRMYEAIYGLLVYRTDQDGRKNSLTNEVIRQHVGLHTNGSKFSFPQFKKYCIGAMERRAKELIQWDDRDREEAA